jgi:hypothetical protein
LNDRVLFSCVGLVLDRTKGRADIIRPAPRRRVGGPGRFCRAFYGRGVACMYVCCLCIHPSVGEEEMGGRE